MFKRLIEWSEKDIGRSRKIVLFSTIIFFFIVTFVLIVVSFIVKPEQMAPAIQIFWSLAGLMAIIYGFFTGTSSDKSGALVDKAVNKLTEKLRLDTKSEM